MVKDEDRGTWTPDDPRCPVCIGPAGDDSMRCERPAWPLHRTHLVDGVYHLPINTDALNALNLATIDEWTRP
ncbi:hypothetical protein [Frigoribacterium sp. PhB118]|uniref:hypothetical protein n=1 Tax=Frigoribacterium sp. PhB118 TaxID=2485175 RepID=UPI000F48471C|nr:hypothetical protein [Frigoribacterium sp. PhB118]ROS57209.1 hypothetical protein EDF21_0864 [Frigoribacterium sp. PhB118]